MRRILVATATAVAVGAGALTAAVPASAATDPVGVSTSASPSSTTIGPSGSGAVALTAVFDDIADNVRGARFEIALPDGNRRTVYASGYLSKAGARETYRASYTPYSFYAPGTYRFTAFAERDYAGAGPAFAGTPSVSGTFVVKHKVTTTIYSSKFVFRPGEKLRFTGTVRNTTDASGLKVTLRFKAKGKKKFKKVGKAVRTNASGEWKSKKVRMTKQGKWFAKVGGKGYVVGTKSAVLTSKFR